MFKKLNSTIIVALCTSSALIAFAFYERHQASGSVPAVALYGAAVLPVLYGLLRHKTCRN
jgi:hypothetical protein